MAKSRGKGSVYRITELVGTSRNSWEDAARNAVETAAHSLRDLRVAYVVDALAKQYGIEPEAEEVRQRFNMQAYMIRQNPADLAQTPFGQRLIMQIRERMLTDTTLQKLAEEVLAAGGGTPAAEPAKAKAAKAPAKVTKSVAAKPAPTKASAPKAPAAVKATAPRPTSSEAPTAGPKRSKTPPRPTSPGPTRRFGSDSRRRRGSPSWTTPTPGTPA